jgi:hypothetical protein
VAEREVAFCAKNAQLDVPPLTLTLSPEYEGEGTRAGDGACREKIRSRLSRVTLTMALSLGGGGSM